MSFDAGAYARFPRYCSVTLRKFVSLKRILTIPKNIPLIEDGGYIPHMDHLVPPDISLDDYWYYRRQKRRLLEQVRPILSART